MKDIDFDELDKAVNSLMGSIKGQSEQPEPKTLNISTTLKDDEQPEYTKLEQVAKKIGSETIGGPVERTAILPEVNGEDTLKTIDLTSAEASASLPAEPTSLVAPPALSAKPAKAALSTVAARRSSGRFMDVMHRSSDMKVAPTTPAPAPHREAAMIVPPEPLPVETVDAAPSQAVEEEPVVSSDTLPLTPDPGLPTPTPEPQSSPFLPDAKVEKRPLGALASEQTDSDDTSLTEEPEDDTQLAPSAQEVAEELLPAELNTDLLAIEKNIAEQEVSLENSEPSAQEQSESREEEKPVNATAPEASEPLGSGSIAQQYKELPNSGEQSSGAIFDVDNYHKQPVHPAKQPASWLWIVAVVVIVMICAAGGAAFYLLSIR